MLRSIQKTMFFSGKVGQAKAPPSHSKHPLNDGKQNDFTESGCGIYHNY